MLHVSDVNECLNETICNNHAECINTKGSYTCVCEFGYTGDGATCTSICPRE